MMEEHGKYAYPTTLLFGLASVSPRIIALAVAAVAGVAALAVIVSLFALLARIGDNLTVLILPVLVILAARGSLVEVAKSVWAPALTGRIRPEAMALESGGSS